MTWRTELADILDSMGSRAVRMDNEPLTFDTLDQIVFQLRKAATSTDELIASLPSGDVVYVRCEDGRWGVAIFTPGSAHRIATIAEGMDKGLACWVAAKLREARA